MAEAAGVRAETLRAWLSSAGFRDALLGRVRDDIVAALPLAKNVLIKKAIEGRDKESLKLILTISGLLEAAKDDAPPAMEPNEVRSLSDAELLERVRRLRKLSGPPGEEPGA